MPLIAISKFWAAALVSLGLLTLGEAMTRTTFVDTLRERMFDRFLRLPAHSPAPDEVRVVDIDRRTLERIGPWPWSRERLAHLVAIIATSRPKAIGLDILLAGPDERSAAALARQLAQAAAGDAGLANFARDAAERLPDADVALAAALRRSPVALSLALDPDNDLPVPRTVPIFRKSLPGLEGLWTERSAIGPVEMVARAAAGLGVLSMPGDADGRIRRVPMLARTDANRERPLPGLALETARLASGSESYALTDDPPILRMGDVRLRFAPDGMLRLRPADPGWHKARTISAADVLERENAGPGLAGRIVLIGSSAEELGGLRSSATSELPVPSVQIQADAVAQIMRSDAPYRADWMWWLERAAALSLGCLAAWSGLLWSPLWAGALGLGMAAGWLGLASVMIAGPGMLLDPLLVPAVAIMGYGIATLYAASNTRRREALIRRRFEQHLAPAVVQRIVDEPHLLKLQGEAREITVIFTDIEGFTSLTERATPMELVALLDRYIDGASRIIVEHGGMVDKVIGDGMHALFNAPLDLAAHPLRALDCALALTAFSDRLRQEPDARRLALGRTRIGIETGMAIVGDVGGGRRLNYTAHGNAVNRAARLEAANKELGSTICIGPGTAIHLPAERLRSLGTLALRGQTGEVQVYEPWPEEMGPEARDAYRSAVAETATEPERAAAQLDALMREFPSDAVLRTMRQRCR